MVSCFFCQNLLSDFIEGILPASRQQEIKNHLENCRDCAHLHLNIKDAVGLLQKLPSTPASPELRQRALIASQSGYRPWASRARVSRWVLAITVPCLLAMGYFSLYPQHFPWKHLLTYQDDETQFIRFFPLMQGASEIVDEQTSWLHGRDLEGGSLWEEGGISPDEFEKAFEPTFSRDTPP